MNDKARTRSTGLAGVTNLAVLAPLRDGMVPGMEPISYVGRLRKVLDTLHASRRNVRESELWSVFPDIVGRFGIIHGFRYALVAPDSVLAGRPVEFGTWRLSLNVTFDGGWEPYMRVIQRDIGPLLDLLFCHSPDYPGSREASFTDYCAWVRRYEVPAGLFFADSASTVDDSHYLAGTEALQRGGASDDALARHRLPSGPERQAAAIAAAWKNPARALAVPLRALKGLYRLTTYFPPNRTANPPEDHAQILKQFAQHALSGPIELMQQIEAAVQAPSLPPKGVELKRRWDEIKGGTLRNELAWLEWDKPTKPAPPPVEAVDTTQLQAHVLGAGERMTHACLVLLRVTQASQALTTIAGWAEDCKPVAEGAIGYLVGFTYPGLEALGVTADRLAALPQEFFEGMEARAALLGDLRTNHPDRWTRPVLEGSAPGQRVDFHAVHLVVQLRLADGANTALLHPRLETKVETLRQQAAGLRVLAVEPLRSYRDAKGLNAVGHMGIADGVSQPKLRSAAASDGSHYDDQVAAGELLLGYANDRGDAAPPNHSFLHNGSFLAVRKLRQFMDRLDAVAPIGTAPGKALLEKMVGRAADGSPLHGLPAGFRHDNDFRFDSPAASDACPFHSHVRRTNPRDGRPYTPRILRRGMSWGPRWPADPGKARGVMFMAYCASLAEQFETVQRWVAGGNASGVASGEGDPLLRVPKEGEAYTFRYLNGGQVQRAVFSDEPLVQLQWGLYAFVPSLEVLSRLVDHTGPAAAAKSPPPRPALSELEAARAMLEDRDKSEVTWEWVRNGDKRAPLDSPYGHLVGTLDGVLDALKDSSASQYSVAIYADRMQASIGLNLLGMDPGTQRERELPVKAAISAFRDEPGAFADAQGVAGDVLTLFLNPERAIPTAPGDVERFAIDLVDFSNGVLSGLCTKWFGVPDRIHMFTGGYLASERPARPSCPGSLGPVSRYNFMPHPQDNLADDGQFHGQAVLKAVEDWLSSRNDATGRPDLTGFPLSLAIQQALEAQGAQDGLAENIAGTLLGFAPSVQSNFLRVIETWLDDGRSFWQVQQALFDRSREAQLKYDDAQAALRAALVAAMRRHPVPTMALRCRVVDGKPDKNQPVVLGLQSAMAETGAPFELMFGRDHADDAKNTTVHGCPGYAMAMGVLLGMIASLMKAGTLRPTGSPVLMILTKPKDP